MKMIIVKTKQIKSVSFSVNSETNDINILNITSNDKVLIEYIVNGRYVQINGNITDIGYGKLYIRNQYARSATEVDITAITKLEIIEKGVDMDDFSD